MLGSLYITPRWRCILLRSVAEASRITVSYPLSITHEGTACSESFSRGIGTLHLHTNPRTPSVISSSSSHVSNHSIQRLLPTKRLSQQALLSPTQPNYPRLLSLMISYPRSLQAPSARLLLSRRPVCFRRLSEPDVTTLASTVTDNIGTIITPEPSYETTTKKSTTLLFLTTMVASKDLNSPRDHNNVYPQNGYPSGPYHYSKH